MHPRSWPFSTNLAEEGKAPLPPSCSARPRLRAHQGVPWRVDAASSAATCGLDSRLRPRPCFGAHGEDPGVDRHVPGGRQGALALGIIDTETGQARGGMDADDDDKEEEGQGPDTTHGPSASGKINPDDDVVAAGSVGEPDLDEDDPDQGVHEGQPDNLMGFLHCLWCSFASISFSA